MSCENVLLENTSFPVYADAMAFQEFSIAVGATVLLFSLSSMMVLIGFRKDVDRKEHWRQLLLLNVTDVLNGLSLMLVSIANYTFVLDSRFNLFIMLTFIFASTLGQGQILILCVMRYFVLRNVTRLQTETKYTWIMTVTNIFLSGVVVGIAVVLLPVDGEYDLDYAFCSITSTGLSAYKSRWIFGMTLHYILTTFVINLVTVLCIVRLRNIQNLNSVANVRSSISRKSMLILFLIVLFHDLATIPATTLHMCLRIWDIELSPLAFEMISRTVVCNSILNSVLYSLSITNARKAFCSCKRTTVDTG